MIRLTAYAEIDFASIIKCAEQLDGVMGAHDALKYARALAPVASLLPNTYEGCKLKSLYPLDPASGSLVHVKE